jgi:YbbR domain-containing protein
MLGYLTRTLAFTPTMATVSGPSAYVAQVVEASTQVSVEEANAAVEGEFSLQILDAEGNWVTHPDIVLAPEAVLVSIPIELSEEYGTLTVRPVRIGQVAFGYRVIDIAAEPPAVSIRGAPEIITALPGYIDTEPIDVEGAQADVIKHPALNVPPDVTLLPDQQVTVTVYIEAIQSSMTVEITPTLQGLEPGLIAAASPRTVEVFLSGPLPQLETLANSDVRVIIDLFDLEPGIYSIEPQAVVPPEVTNYSILPATVQVEISIAPTITPTLTPTITTTVSPIPTPTEE